VYTQYLWPISPLQCFYGPILADTGARNNARSENSRRRCRRRGSTSAGLCLYARIIYCKL